MSTPYIIQAKYYKIHTLIIVFQFNDSTVKVNMLIKKDVWKFIKSDCEVCIGSEGIISDKRIVITQGSVGASLAKDGQILKSKEPVETDTITDLFQIRLESR